MTQGSERMDTWKGSPLVKAKDHKAWRARLAKNHDKEKSAWLVTPHKGKATTDLDYNSAVEEALCFGWVDSTANKYDASNTAQYYAPRGPGSKWSITNHERVARLVEEDLMMPAGQAVIDLAKRSVTWDVLIDAQNDVLPEDLQRAFKKNKTAIKHFIAFPPSSRRLIMEWIASAKRLETRAKRIAETVALAAKNIRANHPRQRDDR